MSANDPEEPFVLRRHGWQAPGLEPPFKNTEVGARSSAKAIFG